MSFLVTGTGRCGTTWAYQALSSAGAQVRQQSFRHEHALGLEPWFLEDYDGEVSYEAAPAADSFDRIVLLWRPCLKVVRSWMGLGVFVPGWEEPYYMLHDSIKRFCPSVLDWRTPAQTGAAFWLEWNELVRERADTVLGIEGLSIFELCNSVGVSLKNDVEELPSDVNNRNDVKEHVSVDWDDFGELTNRVLEYEALLSDIMENDG